MKRNKIFCAALLSAAVFAAMVGCSGENYSIEDKEWQFSTLQNVSCTIYHSDNYIFIISHSAWKSNTCPQKKRACALFFLCRPSLSAKYPILYCMSGEAIKFKVYFLPDTIKVSALAPSAYSIAPTVRKVASPSPKSARYNEAPIASSPYFS